ncbi:conserved Plasmodium protein, unknown function [Plasmodium relictum]|uniref:Histone chaperone domain-containing protein n=1 Tax=Plasmodium relictum TaxID=85471 RepID=A0A1J1H5V0_PLARL|nr:conserved Plasmodium protein, unknown function [Plasmodium relictum]CRH00273.1 conserved Plasmodium protein, unknown function [Plasmodium relictum]
MDTANEVFKIESILDKILPEKDLNLVTLKSVRKDVADHLNVDESYFSENKEKKDLLKRILKEKIFKLYNEQKNEEVEEEKKKYKKEEIKKSTSKNNTKKKKVIERDEENFDEDKGDSGDSEEVYADGLESDSSLKSKKKKKREINSDDDNPPKKKKKEKIDSDDDSTKKKKKRSINNNSKQKNTHMTKKEKLRKIVLELKIGPTIFKDLNKENEDEYNKKLEQRIIEFCEKKQICSEQKRLPNPNEIQEYRKKQKLKEELDGIDPSNIIDSSTRPRRRNPNLYISQKYSESDEDEDDEEENDNDESVVESEEGDEVVDEDTIKKGKGLKKKDKKKMKNEDDIDEEDEMEEEEDEEDEEEEEEDEEEEEEEEDEEDEEEEEEDEEEEEE